MLHSSEMLFVTLFLLQNFIFIFRFPYVFYGWFFQFSIIIIICQNRLIPSITKACVPPQSTWLFKLPHYISTCSSSTSARIVSELPRFRPSAKCEWLRTKWSTQNVSRHESITPYPVSTLEVWACTQNVRRTSDHFCENGLEDGRTMVIIAKFSQIHLFCERTSNSTPFFCSLSDSQPLRVFFTFPSFFMQYKW